MKRRIAPDVLMIAALAGGLIAALVISTCAAATGEVPPTPDQVVVSGQPLTSVVVTQCNLVVAVYMTMADGRLVRFDSSAKIPADELVAMAYTALRSERVEVSCVDTGAVGYERHDPI